MANDGDETPPDTFLPAPGGGYIFGYVDAEVAKAVGCPEGPICLKQGYPAETGFGKLHIEHHDQRVRQTRGLGYATTEAFVYEVAQRYTIVQDGGEGRLILIYQRSGYDLRIVIDPRKSTDGHYWNTITAMPFRQSKKLVLFTKVRSDGSEPASDVAVKRPRFATLSLPKKV